MPTSKASAIEKWRSKRSSRSRCRNISAFDPSPVDVDRFIDERAISHFQWLVVALCAAASFCAGFNLLAPAYLAPRISLELHLAPGMIGALFLSSGLGTTLGTFTGGPLADRYGRRPIMIVALLAAVPFLVLTACSGTLRFLMIGAFGATFALMGLLPIAMAMAGEYAPHRAKTTIAVLVFSGFAAGTIVSGWVAAAVLSGWGWHAVFGIDAALPLFVLAVLAPRLPESLDVLARRPGSESRIAAILHRIDGAFHALSPSRFSVGEREERGFPVSLLFAEGRSVTTLLLWTMFFTNMLTLLSTNMWLPSILHNAHVEEHAAIVIASLMSLGGVFGGIVLSELSDHWPKRRFPMMSTAYVVGGLLVASIAWTGTSLVRLGLVVLLAGCFNYGVQNMANAMLAAFYPVSMRSTGASWAMGIGQSAQIFGPLMTSILVALNWNERSLLAAIALPTLIAAATAAALGVREHRSERSPVVRSHR